MKDDFWKARAGHRTVVISEAVVDRVGDAERQLSQCRNPKPASLLTTYYTPSGQPPNIEIERFFELNNSLGSPPAKSSMDDAHILSFIAAI